MSPFLRLFPLLILLPVAGLAQPDYPLAHWVPPACTKYYTSGNGHHFVVIHDMEGYYEASISYLNRCDTNTNGVLNVQASVYYLVNGQQNGADEDGHTENNPSDAPAGDQPDCHAYRESFALDFSATGQSNGESGNQRSLRGHGRRHPAACLRVALQRGSHLGRHPKQLHAHVRSNQ
jgi:hypothetical protein